MEPLSNSDVRGLDRHEAVIKAYEIIGGEDVM